MVRRVASLVSLVFVLTTTSGAWAEILYYDNFDGLSGVDLNGTVPDITTDGAAWVAGNDFDADGKVTNDGGSMGDSAYLPFVPQDHYIYELSAIIDTRVSPLRNNANDWIALGFAQSNVDPESRFYDDGGSRNPVYWGMTRTDQTTSTDQTFTGVNTAGGQGTTTKSANHMRIVLDTSAARWIVSWYYDGVLQRAVNVDDALKANFQYVVLSHARPDGFIDDFKLTRELAVSAMRSNPASGSLVTSMSVVLEWQPGVYAAQHDVYVGTSPADVNQATPSTSGLYLGRQEPNSVSLADLTPGMTYYWRIDEVNDLHPDKLWRGTIWSFRVIPATAYGPNPADGARYMDPDVDLVWSPGARAQSHKVYFGATHPLPLVATQAATTYALPVLAYETTYYWRVDEVNGTSTWPGEEWRFETRPDIQITDPDLVGWWTFDEGQGTVALDWSGHGNHGTLVNGPAWVTGRDNGGLQFDAIDDHVSLAIGLAISSLTNSTFAVWVDFPNGGPWDQHVFDFGMGTDVRMYLCPRTNGTGPLTFGITAGPDAAETQVTAPSTLGLGWHHVAVTIDAVSNTMQLYDNGEVVGSATTTTMPKDLGNTTQNWLGRNQTGGNTWFAGSLDDFRIYNKALTQGEIGRVMQGDPRLAWDPSPANGRLADSREALPLTWSAGDGAAAHAVYFGTDANAVGQATPSDTTGIYRGQQAGTAYSPPEGVAWGQTYTWRIDEVQADGTAVQGKPWTFSVADYFIVDDFEAYDDECNRVFFGWLGGASDSGSTNPACPRPEYGGNGTGSAVGNYNPPFAEQTVVRSGEQSMPVEYDNTRSPFTSEVEHRWSTAQDWTEGAVTALTLSVRGDAPAFLEGPDGTITMNGTGADIWGNSDEFRFAYKSLKGNGSITAKVEAVTNVNSNAKAGVMIRETLNADSMHALVNITPGAGAEFIRRVTTAGETVATGQADVAAPYWVKLTRNGNLFTAQCSADGVTWTGVGADPAASSVEIPMGQDVYIGLAVTSRTAETAWVCGARFSNITTAGDVTGAWDQMAIGVAQAAGNPPETFYAAVEDSAGSAKVILHPDPAVICTGDWEEWTIPLSEFASGGVNLKAVKELRLGVGNPGAPTAGGLGKLYIDDIRLTRLANP